MRYFNYSKSEDLNSVSTTVKEYIKQLDFDLDYLTKNSSNKAIYLHFYDKLLDFRIKYSNLEEVQNQITNDLLSAPNVEYCFKNGKYAEDASELGVEFSKDLSEIFKYEESLREYTSKVWENSLTNFDDIVNGERFMIVGHSSSFLPGLKGDDNYSEHRTKYLSCSLFSNLELNAYRDSCLIFVVDVNNDNYLASSPKDCFTGDSSEPSIHTVKEIEKDGKKCYIDTGSGDEFWRVVTTIETPQMIEELNVKRDLEINKKLYDYNNILCNEIVLYRDTTKYKGAVILSNGCDVLIDKYLYLKEQDIPFKCINKGLYKIQKGLEEFSDDDYEKFTKDLEKLDQKISNGYVTTKQLNDYYEEVVIPMKYDDRVKTGFQELVTKYNQTKTR